MIKIGMTKFDVGKKISADFTALRAKIYAYRMIDTKLEYKHSKGTKMCAVTKHLTLLTL